MPKAQVTKQGAVLIHGADGRIYFIPKASLKQFVVPRKHHQHVAKATRKGLGSALKDIGVMKSDSALISSVSIRGARR